MSKGDCASLKIKVTKMFPFYDHILVEFSMLMHCLKSQLPKTHFSSYDAKPFLAVFSTERREIY